MKLDETAMATSPSVGEEAPARAPAQPRLGISHLMIWMAGAAVCLAMQRVISGAGGLEGEFLVFTLLVTLPYTLFAGALLGCLAVGVTRLVRGVPFPVHPGQWLAMLGGITTIGSWLVGVAHELTAEAPFAFWTYDAFYAANALNDAIFAAGCALAVMRGGFDRRWNAVLIAVAVLEVLASGSGLVLYGVTRLMTAVYMNYTPSTGPLTWVLVGTVITALSAFVVIPLSIFAAWGDRRRGISRDWMHWVGALGVMWEPAAAWLVVIINFVTMAAAR